MLLRSVPGWIYSAQARKTSINWPRFVGPPAPSKMPFLTLQKTQSSSDRSISMSWKLLASSFVPLRLMEMLHPGLSRVPMLIPKAYAQEARKTTPRSLPKVSYGSDADSVKVFPFAVTLAQIPLLKPGECVHKGSSETGVSGRQSSTNGQTGQRCGNKRLAGVKWPLSSWYPLWALRLKPFSAKLLRVRRSMGYPEV